MGLMLLYHALLAYGFRIYGDLRLLTMESTAAALLLVLAAVLFPEKSARRDVLIAGADPLGSAFLSGFDRPVLGSVGVEHPGIPYLGDLTRFEEIVARHRPVEVVVGAATAPAIPARVLWQLPVQGISIQTPVSIYERTLRRVPIRGLQPTDLVLSPALRPNSRVMAIQAVYTNLIGLTLLLALSPIMLLLSLLIVVTRSGPILEGIDCAGFQKIPFRFLRFRTFRADGGAGRTVAGKVISKLRLENLPQLINIVRGEMTLFGPAPVRRVFAGWFTRMLPFYGHRFSVKPGILGWAQVHCPDDGMMGELSRLEYDLYYIKKGSPFLDFEILLRTLAAWITRRRPSNDRAE
jgi:lipopolysaccharide/colanic/teichoic acid biosynthesis glycosyltransferase